MQGLGVKGFGSRVLELRTDLTTRKASTLNPLGLRL